MSIELIKHALVTKVAAKKAHVSSTIHAFSQAKLQDVNKFISNTESKVFFKYICSLDDLAETCMQLQKSVTSLQDLAEMRVILDEVENHAFVPLNFSDIEQLYDILHKLGERVSTEEISSVSTLFERCDRFSREVPDMCHQLMTDKRKSFEQLLDTQLKNLLVSSIHLRDAFEENGPLTPNLSAKEATMRLREVEKGYKSRCEQKQVCSRNQTIVLFSCFNTLSGTAIGAAALWTAGHSISRAGSPWPRNCSIQSSLRSFRSFCQIQ